MPSLRHGYCSVQMNNLFTPLLRLVKEGRGKYESCMAQQRLCVDNTIRKVTCTRADGLRAVRAKGGALFLDKSQNFLRTALPSWRIPLTANAARRKEVVSFECRKALRQGQMNLGEEGESRLTYRYRDQKPQMQ